MNFSFGEAASILAISVGTLGIASAVQAQPTVADGFTIEEFVSGVGNPLALATHLSVLSRS
jgi:hypothetical protein